MERSRKKGIQIRRMVLFLSLVLCGLCMVSAKGYAADKEAQDSFNYSNADVKDGSILGKQIDAATPSDDKNVFYLLGFIAGILLGVLILFIFSKIVKKFGGKVVFGCGKDRKDYDERQMFVRGKAYEAGFFTLIGYILIVGMLLDVMECSFIISFGVLWIGVAISIGIFVIICIVKDAYVSLRENAKGILIMFGSIGFLNLVSGLPNRNNWLEKVEITRNGQTMECTKLLPGIVNLVLGILFFILMAVLIGKIWYDKKQEKEDIEE